MYGFTSTSARTSLHLIVIASFAAAILLFSGASVPGVPVPWVFQLTGICFGALGVYLLTRYALRSYRYEITKTDLVSADGENVLDLTVTQAVGNKLTVAARISLRDVTDVEVLGRKEFRQKKAALVGGLTLFRYENTPFEPVSCYIVVPDERSVLAIPADDGMVRLLTDAAAANRYTAPDPADE